jgi:hypothetical protein
MRKRLLFVSTLAYAFVGLLIVAGVAFGLFILAVAGWAWYHRSSRYMPA